MAVRRVVERLCDPCETAGKEVVATGQIKVVRSWDVCAVHEKRYDTYFAAVFDGEALEEVGQLDQAGEDEHQEQADEEAVTAQSEESKPELAPAVPDSAETANDGGPEQEPAADEATARRRTVVITGEISGYKAAEVRRAVEALGYEVVANLDADTSLIICGRRPAVVKVHDARYYKTPVFDASQVSSFREALDIGEFPTGDKLPDVRGHRRANPTMSKAS